MVVFNLYCASCIHGIVKGCCPVKFYRIYTYPVVIGRYGPVVASIPLCGLCANYDVLWFQVGTDPIGGDLWRKMTMSSVKFWYHMHESFDDAFHYLWHCTILEFNDVFDEFLTCGVLR